jgi:hypothetical protein
MTRVVKGQKLVALVIALVAVGGWMVTRTLPALAQSDSILIGLSRPTLLSIKWFGPFALTPNDTVRFNYTNLGGDTVKVEWALTNALTGETVCANFGTPAEVKAGAGIIWDYSQTLELVPEPNDSGEQIYQETRNCAGETETEEPGEVYFDHTLRHGLVGWIFILHANEMAMRRAVDLPTIELFNSMVMKDGTRSMTFGRTFA